MFLGCHLSHFTAGAQTTSTQVKAYLFVTTGHFGSLDIGNPAPIGAPLGMAHVMAKLSGLTTVITLHNLGIVSFD